MNGAILIGLVQNVALLLAAAFIFDVAAIRWRTRQSLLRQGSVGLVLGTIGIAVMLSHWEFMPGILFDTRSVLLSISGFFFGTFSTAIAMAMTAAFRFHQGGAGTWTGIVVILVSGASGIIWRHFRRRPLADTSWRELCLFGTAVHLLMLATMFTLPWEAALRVLSTITLPVLIVYPPGTALLGALMVNRLRRELTDDALRASETGYRKLHQSMMDAFVATDMEGHIRDFNESYLHMLGYTPAEIRALTYMDITPEQWHAMEKAVVENQVLARGYSDVYEKEYRKKDGTVFPVELRTTLLTDNAGTPIGMWAIVHDITDRKLAEKRLRDAETHYRLLFEHSPMGIVIIDPATAKLIAFNETAHRQLGYSRDEFARLSIADFEAVETPEETKRRIATVMKEGHYRFETRHRTRRGEIRDVLVVAQYDAISDHQVYHCIWQDITESRRAEEEKRSLEERLHRAEKMEAVGQLAGGVAHDLNNVLGVSTVYAELLQEKIPAESPLRRYVDLILASTEKCAAIIEDLLTLARRGVTVSEVMDLNGIVKGFLKTPVFEKIQAYHPNVTFRTEYQADLLNIRGSPVHLEKTLMNLVANAAEAIDGKGEVIIRTESLYLDRPVRGYDEVKPGDYTVLSVSDTGIGIPAENIGKIFEPFYTKKAMGRSGTGLGLAIVWGTVRDHDGYIDVQTEVGQGTKFMLFFPVTREERIASPQKMPLARYKGRGESVLVIDDVADQREVAVNVLARLGYDPHAVSSGEEAVEYLKGHRADILVLDMIMAPGIDGLETYRRVLEIHPGQKAVLVSGFSETERVKEAQDLGAGAYVKKPYMMERIGLAIRNELDRR